MWILENSGEALSGRRLWLRPGKRYLFGRTAAEPGQLTIQGPNAKTVSRKHVVIHVDPVPEGQGQNLRSRSKVTIEHLGSKAGTTVNGQPLKGEKYVIQQDENALQMGLLPKEFRITWLPVVLSYSFTSKQMLKDPLTKLRNDLEQLDIKFLAHYDAQTTHVVSRKRNTPKGLQALINGSHIVNDSFVDAVVAAAAPQPQGDGSANSSLEGDFDGHWPDALAHLPPPANEPEPRKAEDFKPNPARQTLFEGYVFIFYEQHQFDSLLAPITDGGGKALVRQAVPHETQVDDFVRYVKGVAGEKGLGEFEDGSVGKGVVVVKYFPANGENMEWFTEFFRDVSLRLDHRLIDQKDFIGAILGNDASVLRRPLEDETPPTTQSGPSFSAQQQPTDTLDKSGPAVSQPSYRRRDRGAKRGRFRGFDVDSDNEKDDGVAISAAVPEPEPEPQPEPAAEASQEGLFVSQEAASPAPEVLAAPSRRSRRKRSVSAVSPAEQQDLTEVAPNPAKQKRRRIQRDETPVSQRPSPPPRVPSPPPAPVVDDNADMEVVPSAPVGKTVNKAAKEKMQSDIISLARAEREREEARIRSEQAEMAVGPEGYDLDEIRQRQVEVSMEVRAPVAVAAAGTGAAAGVDGGDRWDPAWNGRKNFKKFRQRGAVAPARPPIPIIVPLVQVEVQKFSLTDDYWLEDRSNSLKERRRAAFREKHLGEKERSQGQGHSTLATSGSDNGGAEQQQQRSQNTNRASETRRVDSSDSEAGAVDNQGDDNGDDNDDDDEPIVSRSTRLRASQAAGDDNNDDDDDDEEPIVSRSTRSRASQAARQPSSTLSQQHTQSTVAATESQASRTKRAAAAPPAKRKPAKRPRIALALAGDDDDEDSDDGLRFKFRKP